MGFNWFWNYFKDNKVECVSCDLKYPKDAMKSIWYKYEHNGVVYNDAVYLCDPCADEIAKEIEDKVTEFEDEDFGSDD